MPAEHARIGPELAHFLFAIAPSGEVELVELVGLVDQLVMRLRPVSSKGAIIMRMSSDVR